MVAIAVFAAVTARAAVGFAGLFADVIVIDASAVIATPTAVVIVIALVDTDAVLEFI